MGVGVVFVVLMAIGIGVGTFGIYNFDDKRYSFLIYVFGLMMLIPMMFFGFEDDLMVLSIVTLLFGSVLYGWMWICYGCTVMFYGSVLRDDKSGLNFNGKRTRA